MVLLSSNRCPMTTGAFQRPRAHSNVYRRIQFTIVSILATERTVRHRQQLPTALVSLAPLQSESTVESAGEESFLLVVPTVCISLWAKPMLRSPNLSQI